MSEESKDALNPHTGQPWPADTGDASGGNAPGAPASAAPAAPGPDAPPQKGPPQWSSVPSQQELAVRASLETVMDPEIQLSVIDLGLIREIHFREDSTLVRMMLTTPFCPYAPQMVQDVKVATESAVPQICEVELMADAWSPEMMPDPSLLGFSY